MGALHCKSGIPLSQRSFSWFEGDFLCKHSYGYGVSSISSLAAKAGVLIPCLVVAISIMMVVLNLSAIGKTTLNYQ